MTIKKCNPTIKPFPETVLEFPPQEVFEIVTISPIKQSIIAAIEETEIINTFYKGIGLNYCRKCGETKRTNNTGAIFCPANKASCSGLID